MFIIKALHFKNVLMVFIGSNALKSGKEPTTVEINMRLSYVNSVMATHEHLMSKTDQQPTCTNTIKHCFKKCLQWKDTREKCIHSDIKKCYLDGVVNWKR